MREVLSSPEWLITEDGFDPERANVRETLCTVGNGYLGTRGTLKEGHTGDLSGTYLAGVYDAHDSPVVDLVNAPDWLSFAVYVDGTRLDARNAAVLDHERTLTCAPAALPAHGLRGRDGRRTRLETLRCASMADRRTCALRVEITPVNHESEITVESALDGRRRNLERLPVYPSGTTFAGDALGEWALTRHLDRTERRRRRRRLPGDAHDRERHHARLRGDDPALGRPHLERVPGGGRADHLAGRLPRRPDAAGQARAHRHVARRRRRPGQGRLSRRLAAARSAGFDAIVAASAAAWEERAGTTATSRSTATRRAHRPCGFGVYHLLIGQRRRPHRQHRREVAVREGYRGHVFWDTEILMLPSSPSPVPRRRAACSPTATTRCPARGRTPGSTARRERATRGSRPTPAWRSAPSSPRTGPTGSGRARRRCTSTPTSRAG